MDTKNPFEGLDNIPAEPAAPPTTEPSRAHIPLVDAPHAAPASTTQPPTNAPWKPSGAAPVKKSRSKTWLAVTAIVIVGVLGGGYFVYSQGYVSLPFSIPFVSTPTERFMTKLAGSGTQLNQAEYDFKIDIVTEPRYPKQPAVSLKNTADQSDAFGVL
ncbi:MAG: hypothetical protein HY976_02745, partial [Candidatus Kerfeldbacteria bacterium]|nr:hypothetical protein [Candidatus Kerfeldbacteria bacterium]